MCSSDLQWVLDEITSRQQFLDYIRPKLETIRESGTLAYAEIGEVAREAVGPCVVLAQGTVENLVATVLVRVEGERISRIDLCAVPSPRSVRRSGEYPGHPLVANQTAR